MTKCKMVFNSLFLSLYNFNSEWFERAVRTAELIVFRRVSESS